MQAFDFGFSVAISLEVPYLFRRGSAFLVWSTPDRVDPKRFN
ncbi:hypothetical protein HDF15_000743 [Granulicella mallensis]|uniref:Uncharacterized protein n=1 Tax=Granulicella mallensis TaxID=940614 RepID=A0A7W7ZMF7_9BACT|nr:hypothetical protein [Granulicella mallensis]